MRKWLAAGLLFAMGCGDQYGASSKPMLPITQVPPVVKRSALARNPGVRYHTAWKLPNGGYQLRGQDVRGKPFEIQLRADGSVLQVN